MHVRKRVTRIVGSAARRNRMTVAVVAVALLLLWPLAFTWSGEVLLLNTLGAGIAGVIFRLFSMFRRRGTHGDQ